MLARLKHHLNSAKNHQGFRRYFENTAWMFAEQILRVVAALFVGIWVARYLGPGQLGVFSYAVAFAAIFSSIAKLGFDGIVVRDLVRQPSQRDIYLGTAFWLKLGGAIIALAAIAFAVQLTSNDRTTNLYIFIIVSGAIFQPFEVIDFYFQSKVLSKFISICKMTQLLLSSLLKIYLVLTGADLFWFVVVSLVDQATLAVALYIVYRYQKIGNFYRHFDLPTAKKILKDSWPLILAGLAVMLYMRVDVVMLHHMVGEREVGIYAAATNISEVWYLLPIIIVASVSPAIIKAHSLDPGLYISRLRKLYFVMAWLAIGISLPLSLLSGTIVDILFGIEFAEAAPVFAIHLWASIAVFLGVASSKYLLVEQLQKISFYRALIGLACNVLINLVLIPSMGAKGAAIATVISYFVATFSLIFFKSTRAHTVYLLLALRPQK